MKKIVLFIIIWFFLPLVVNCQNLSSTDPIEKYNFEGNINSILGLSANGTIDGNISYVEGLDGQALNIRFDNGFNSVSINTLQLDGTKDFSLQFWVKTTSSNPTVLISNKNFKDKGVTTQKNAGWALYSTGGTFAWTIGSGDRRVSYERDNGEIMPINDGKWHQLTVTYNKELSEFRLYYDGRNKAIYKVGFDFVNDEPLVLGSKESNLDYNNIILPEIENGAKQLQNMVDEFNRLDLDDINPEEFISLIVDPQELVQLKLEEQGFRDIELKEKSDSINLEKVNEIRRQLGSNPYTVFQNRNLTMLKPVSKIYSLKSKKVVINKNIAESYTLSEKLYPSDFNIDELSIWERAISSDEVWQGFTQYQYSDNVRLANNLKALTVGVWNIWHGGKHFTQEVDGWDSRKRIVEMIKKENIDIILMQETYSSGDYIAAELGWYFATTSDWDYKMQGANISVLSRFPIKELFVTKETEFNNVAVKLAISETQEIYAMSNWYGMAQFNDVFIFNNSRFNESDNIPVLFGGDFNAVPHTDGGESPASKKMLESGFTDAFRGLYPDVQKYPGYSYQSGIRIDQLYYKGIGLKNTSTKVISEWSGGFPSDHYLIKSQFDLSYSTVKK